mgnify:CR=1 FL=1
MASNAYAGDYRKCLPRNMVRFHASTGLARLPYFFAVPCLIPQLQSILSQFVHREPGVPSNLPLELALYQQYDRLPQWTLHCKIALMVSIDEVGHGIWRSARRKVQEPQESIAIGQLVSNYPTIRFLGRREPK